MTDSRDGYVLEAVEEGQTYYFKVVSTNIWGGSENFDVAVQLERTVLGLTGSPGGMASLTAVANGDSVSIYGPQLAEDNVEGYEVRLGGVFASGLFMSFNKAPSLRLNGVRPGVHTFGMCAKNNAGRYSSSPVYAACRVFIPPGFTMEHSWSWDFTTGTFDNAEHGTYNSQDILKCSHTGNETIDPDLVARWKLDAGALTVDSVGSNTLTNYGAASDTAIQREGDGCAEFTAAENDYLEIADADLASGFPLKSGESNTTLSVCMWCRPKSTGTLQYLVAKYDPTNNKRSFAITLQANGLIGINIGYNSGAAYEGKEATPVLAADTWYHIGVVFNGAAETCKVRIRPAGGSATEDLLEFAESISITDAALRLGARSDNANYFNGFLDEVLVFDDELTSAEIDQIAEQTFFTVSSDIDLVGVWTSPTYDMGALKKVRVWGDFLTVFFSGSNTWAGVLPSPAPWSNVNPSAFTWGEIFRQLEAARLEAKLLFSEDGSSWSEVDWFAVLCAEVYARYHRVEIKITDPSADSNLYVYELNMVAYTGPN
ncbi:LamG domain-containing protein [Desulfatitalea tepidiphila]|uniref:LamG domain-containing protein n=1 Tax=Desulfatitalea tepidiphila TaxID=1185843 RepID=UPI0006B539BB|nr:LamG domain-containing protein [Desulfatitalea tepidiphila]